MNQQPKAGGRVTIACPNCQEKYSVEVVRIPPQGGKLTCRICGGRVLLPGRPPISAPVVVAAVPAFAEEPPSHETGVDRTTPVVESRARPEAPHERAGAEVTCPHCGGVFVTQAGSLEASPSAPRDSRKTILIVEDTEFFLSLASEALGERYRTVMARTTREALRLLRAEPVDLIILDLSLESGEDGTAVLAGAAPRGIPCLIFTAKSEAEMWGEAWNQLREKGATDLVLKGMNIEEQLLTKVDALLSAPSS